MNRFGIPFLAAPLLGLLLGTACSSMSMGGSNRVLQSVIVTPATADAQSFPGGQVQFTATGNFSAPPTPVKPLAVSGWTSSATSVATVDINSGVAQCVSGASGTVTITARASRGPDMPMPGTAVLVSGSAQLNCP
jgi:hypothetical protein